MHTNFILKQYTHEYIVYLFNNWFAFGGKNNFSNVPFFDTRIWEKFSSSVTKFCHKIHYETLGYHMVKPPISHFIWVWFGTGLWQTDDEETGGRTDKITVANMH